MAVSDGDTITVVKDMGLVSHAFDERTLAPLQGHLAIGHVRYSTTGASTWSNAQPVYRGVGDAGIALGHNGNLVNTDPLAESAGVLPGMIGSDSDLVGELLMQEMLTGDRIVHSDGRDLERALAGCSPGWRAPSPSSSWTTPTSSASATPTASAPSAWDGSTTAGSSPRRRPPSTSSAPTSSGRSSPARWW